MAITAAQLRAFSPNASQSIIDGIVANQKSLVDAGITTPLRIAHFFAQVGNETGGLSRLEENLSYSAQRLIQVWPARFKSIASAEPYAHNPVKLANKVYGGRLGNSGPNDGWNYRGSGLLQDTGKSNFAEVERETGLQVVAHPDLLRTFPGALQAACLYWKKRGINKLADADDVTAVTHAVNGGTIGLADRKRWLARAKKVWTAKAAKPTAAPDPADGGVQVVPAPDPIIEPQEVVVAAQPEPVIDKAAIQTVQKRLAELNYNPGSADGVMGPLTKGAILAFRNDNELLVKDEIDKEFLAALNTAKPRQMATDRANATPTQVAKMVPEANVHWWNRLGAAIVGGGTAAGAGLDYLAPATSYLQPVKDFIGDIPPYAWVALIVLITVALYTASEYGQKKATEAYQSGDRR